MKILLTKGLVVLIFTQTFSFLMFSLNLTAFPNQMAPQGAHCNPNGMNDSHGVTKSHQWSLGCK